MKVSIELENDKVKSFGQGEHSADQPTQGDQPIGDAQPESKTADPKDWTVKGM